MCEYLDRIIAEGEAKGRAEGRAEGTLETLISLVQDGLLSLEEATGRANISEEEFRKKMH